MGQRQDYLKEICTKKFGGGNHSRPSGFEILNTTFIKEINEVYSKLNGQLDIPPTGFGSWDIDLKDFILELDEERHFNRYRLQTLDSDFYSGWKFFDIANYTKFCSIYEKECLNSASWGKNWKNNSTEKQFGTSSEPKNFDGNGSSRWKQRAYYDFLKDISAKIIHVPIIRISIWENVEYTIVDELIKSNRKDILLKLIERKINIHVG